MSKNNVILFATIVITFFSIVYGFFYTAQKYYIPILSGQELYTDYSVYYQAAQHFSIDKNSVYALSAPDAKGGSFNYPPFSMLLFYPLSLLPFSVSYILFSLLNTSCCVAVGYITLILVRTYSQFHISRPRALWFLFLCAGLAPVTQNAKHAQINGIIALLCMLSVFFMLRKRYNLSALCISLGFGLKLYPVLLLAPLIATLCQNTISTQRTTQIISITAMFGGIQCVSLVLIPPSLYMFYFTEYMPLLSDYTCLSGFNQSFSGIVMRILTPEFNAGSWSIVQIEPIVKAIVLCTQVTGIMWTIRSLLKHNIPFHSFFLCSVIIAGMPLLSPLGWEYVYVLCLPLIGIAFSMSFSQNTNHKPIWYLTMITLLTLCIPKIGDDALLRLQTHFPDIIFHLYFSRWFLLVITLIVLLYKTIKDLIPITKSTVT
ncbi:MAG TPA: glycosyltransferase family 87 protein [Candidatus Kapabacteria bacterium]|nr:glycosyltransferase family 87 protein [Candidatus Kapabacteria bacterium]